MGSTIIRLDEGDSVVDVSVISSNDENENDNVIPFEDEEAENENS